MVFEQKEFTPIANFPGYYICRDTSEVLSTLPRRNSKANEIKILKQVNNSKSPRNNYFIVTLISPLRERKNRSIHRLMCETFLPNPENKAHVNHKDGNKLNNSIDNLEWATEKENSQHAVATGLTTYDHFKKVVHQYTHPELVYVQSFPSDAEAEIATGISKQNISKVTLGLRNHAGKFFWSRTIN